VKIEEEDSLVKPKRRKRPSNTRRVVEGRGFPLPMVTACC
jgi:hypothetical protein